MNLTDYKQLIKEDLLNSFPNLETQMGTTDYNKLIVGITKKPLRYLLNELHNRIGPGIRYDEMVAMLRADFSVDIGG